MPRIVAALVVALALAAVPASAAPPRTLAQTSAPQPNVVEAPGEPMTQSDTRGSGLPRRAPDPRTLREYWPVFVGFTLAWLGIVSYLLSIGRSFGRTASALAALEERKSAP